LNLIGSQAFIPNLRGGAQIAYSSAPKIAGKGITNSYAMR
jgi:hypothetical protein